MHDLTGWLRTSSALLAAVTALLVGLTALAQRLMVTWKSAQSGSPAQTVTRWYTIVGLVLVSVGAGTFFARSIVSDLSPINVQGVQMAWSAYNAKDWKASIRFADQCMQQFGPVAEQIQTRLESQHAPIPPTGQVSEMERTRLFQNGVLNDVATCAFIKGVCC